MQNISIVIPVYNRANIVSRTLKTVVAQSYRPLEIVLVDNCSTDGTLAVLQQFASQYNAPDFKVKVVQETIHTAAAARNRGTKETTSKWIMFFDSDDEMSNDLVETYVKCLDDSNKVDIVSTGAIIKFTDGTQRILPFFTKDMLAVQILHSQLATQRYIIRKEFLCKCGKWDTSLLEWDDWELGMRLLLNNPRITYIRGTHVTVNHSGEQSITGNNFKSKAGVWEHVIDVVQNEVTQSSIGNKHRYQRLLEYKRLVLAAQYKLEGEKSLSDNLRHHAMQQLAATYDNSPKWKYVISPIVRWLFNRVSSGKRGAARVAIKIFG